VVGCRVPLIPVRLPEFFLTEEKLLTGLNFPDACVGNNFGVLGCNGVNGTDFGDN
jgi:hypothetical protein